MMHKIKKGYILPSAALTLTRKQIRRYEPLGKQPEAGDVVYGEISWIGQHASLENKSGRIHAIHHGSRALFVFGNRYAPDYYEGFVPLQMTEEVDLLARSGVIGQVGTKSSRVIDPTRVRILGYVCHEDGTVLNTRTMPLITPNRQNKQFPRARMILVLGTAMNSGKSTAATACCWALSALGHQVRASKVTGTASLKDILHMNDAGAHPYADFTFFGHPSTYMLSESDLLSVFNQLDLKYANNPKNYWVVEFADGILQRETAMLLRSSDVRQRIDRLIFCANDAFGAIGGLEVLSDQFSLIPNALSGICTSSPLHVRELAQFTDIPIFNSANVEIQTLTSILTGDRNSTVMPSVDLSNSVVDLAAA